MNDIFSKLNTLKSIEPNEDWVVDVKKRVLLDAPVLEKKNFVNVLGAELRSFGAQLREHSQNLSFQKMAVPAFALVFVLSTGVFTVGVSKSSSPGEFLYSLKMINEDVILAIAPESKKAEIEMEQAGKRLEEMAVISKKTSDVEQQKKIGQLMERFEEKVNNANSRLANSNGNGEKVKVAKTINTQSKKYTEVLAKTTEELPTVVKDEIIEDVEKAVASSEKIYLTSLTAMIKGMTNDDKEEITAMVKEKVGEKENEEEGVVANEENTEDVEDNIDVDVENTETEEDIIDEQDITEDVIDNTEETTEITKDIEDIKKELLEDLDNLNNPEKDGEVLGDEECVCEVDVLNDCVCEEEVEINEDEIDSNL